MDSKFCIYLYGIATGTFFLYTITIICIKLLHINIFG